MDKVTSKSKLSDIVSVAQLKKKFKAYLVDQEYSDFKSSVFPRNLIFVLIMILEELLSDSLEYTVKNAVDGIYPISKQMIEMILYKSNKYDCVQKYLKKYNNTIKYHDSIFFAIKKVYDNLEVKHGSKLMIDSECRNFLSYLLLSLQYEFSDLAIKFVDYANRKTLNKEVLFRVYSSYLDKSISSKIKLKLDSMDEVIETEADENEDDTDAEETEETEETVEAVEVVEEAD